MRRGIWSGRNHGIKWNRDKVRCEIGTLQSNISFQEGRLISSYSTTVRDILENLCHAEIFSDIWKNNLVTEDSKSEALITAEMINFLIFKLRQSFSDTLILRKRM